MKLYLHIGTEKTGTTSIQNFLVANEQKLFKLGFGISKVCGVGNNRKLASFAMRDERSDDFFEAHNLKSLEERKKFKLNLQKNFEKEVLDYNGKVHSMIISSEHFHSRCVNRDELNKLKNLLLDNFEEIKIVCYLRPQVELATSLYSTALRVGFSHTAEEFISNELKPENYYYNYLSIYENWSSVFGESNIDIRVYGEKYFYGSGLIEDFCHFLDLEISKYGFIETPSSNKSINRLGQLMLRRLNEKLSINDSNDDDLRRSFVDWLESKFCGKGFRCSKEKEEILQQQFDEGNSFVLKKVSNGNLENFFVREYAEESKDVDLEHNLIDVALDLWRSDDVLNSQDIDVIRDSAIELEEKNINIAVKLMKIAHKLRPNGEYINNKLTSYERMILKDDS